MDENFNKCLDFVLRFEGGFVNHPDDPGGATNHGITKRTLEQFFGRPFNVTDVRNLSKDTAAEIYKKQYWGVAKGLPSGADLAVFDAGVNIGPARARRMWDRTVELNPGLGLPDLIRRFGLARETYYRALKHFPTFGRGWLRRNNACIEEALKMVKPGEW